LPEESCRARLLEGATVELRLPLRARTADARLHSVPASAITHLGNEPALFVQVEERRFEAQRVAQVEVWDERAYLSWSGPPDAHVAVAGAVLLKGELMRGDLQ
jgi:hypothetical protein